MVPLMSLWAPILLSAVIVFVASWIFYVLLPFHHGDMQRLPKEEEAMDALRPFAIPPGDYGMPAPRSMKGMKIPEFFEKMNKGPVAFITIIPNGPPRMGAGLVLWFLYCVVVSIFSAYIAGRALPSGGDYLQVFRFAGCTAFVGYSLALLQDSIGSRRRWRTTLLSMFDGLIYGLLTAGIFSGLWPHMIR